MIFPYETEFPNEILYKCVTHRRFLKESVFFQCIPSKFLKQKGFSRIEFLNEMVLKCGKRWVFLGNLNFSMKYIRNVLTIHVL